MRIFIVRHGETEANAQRVIQGHGQNPLNAAGRRQAKALAKRLQNEKIDFCFSSDLTRARETAEIIAGINGFSVTYTLALRERCYGEFEGRSVADYEAALKTSEVAREFFRPQFGENYQDVQKRISAFLQSITSSLHGDTILLVGHAGTNKTLLKLFLPSDVSNLEQSNACLNLVETSGRDGAQVVFLNCTAHLDSAGIHHLQTYE